MGCNCKNNDVPLSLKKQIRREVKEKIAVVKRLWKESSDTMTVSGDQLGFKETTQK